MASILGEFDYGNVSSEAQFKKISHLVRLWSLCHATNKNYWTGLERMIIGKLKFQISGLRELKAWLVKLENGLNDEQGNTEPPTLANVIPNSISRREQIGQQRRYQSINNLKAAWNILNFLQANNILDMAGLDKFLKSIVGAGCRCSSKIHSNYLRFFLIFQNILIDIANITTNADTIIMIKTGMLNGLWGSS